MSIASSLSAVGTLNQETHDALRDEVRQRGRLLDLDRGTTPPSFRSVLNGIDVEFETDHFAVINKPPGIVVSLTKDLGDAPLDSAESRGTSPELQNIIKTVSPFPISSDPRFAHGILHRLDRETSGALLIAKSFEAFYDLRLQFACNGILKEYTTIVHGAIRPLGKSVIVDSRIATTKTIREGNVVLKSAVSNENTSKHAKTTLQPIATMRNQSSGDVYTLCRVIIETGRSHQIRVHLSSIGHPIVNDVKYGAPGGSGRILLHASKLAFTDLGSNDPVEVEARLAGDMHAFIAALEKIDSM